tara:strand:- start:8397 stop:9149 length:753 start_codon:yes stop_codon:yes gene_type:complete
MKSQSIINANIIISEINNIISGKSIADIINYETDNIYNKSATSVIVKKYIDKNCLYNLDSLKLFKISLKFIPVSSEHKSYEAMSFSNNSLYDILFEDWNSKDILEIPSLKKQLDCIFLFVPIIKIKTKGIFNNYRDWKIGKLSLWRPSSKELKLIGEEWNQTQKIIKEGVVLKAVKHGTIFRTSNNLPKQSETDFIHLRPHAKNSFDYDIPFLKYTNGAIEITKQSFWLNQKFINFLLKKYRWKMILKEE